RNSVEYQKGSKLQVSRTEILQRTEEALFTSTAIETRDMETNKYPL
ncbi:unnamed protein product, partial [Brassica rapa subsp. trilocularis]